MSERRILRYEVPVDDQWHVMDLHGEGGMTTPQLPVPASAIESAGEVICGADAVSCYCSLPPGHDGAHECHRDGCNGSWTGTAGEDDFVPIRFPGWLS